MFVFFYGRLLSDFGCCDISRMAVHCPHQGEGILRIALIGHGKMGAALLAQWRKIDDRDFVNHHFFVIDPAADPEAGGFDRVTFLRAPPPVAGSAFDLVIVAVKPQIVDAVLPDYASRLAEGGFVASIAAGCSLARLSALAGGVPVIRIMPNLPAAIGAGVSGLCADRSATESLRRRP
jgi:pyrroline-5-carboxylate reductase